MAEPDSGWKSLEKAKFRLEIVKLIVGVLVAAGVWQLGDSATKSRNREVDQHEDQARVDAQIKALVDQRLQLWGKISPAVNDIYVYFVRVGRWKELDGQKILSKKREVDALMYSNQIMWSPAFFKTYEGLIASAFTTFRGEGLNAALRTSRQGRPEGPMQGITFEEADTSGVFDAYWAWQKAAAKELHVDVPEVPDKDKTLKASSAP